MQAIVYESSSVESITFVNDETYPWVYSDGYLRSTNTTEGSKAELSFTYTSSYTTQVRFEWTNFDTWYHDGQYYVDGVYRAENTDTRIVAQQFYLPAGTHVITFRDTLRTSGNSNPVLGIRNIRVLEVLPLENVVVAEGSMPLTFENNSEYPWVILSDNYVQSGNGLAKDTKSSFSTTFTITEPSMLSYDFMAYYEPKPSDYTTDYFQKLTTYINDDELYCDYGASEFTNRSVILAPGTYTVRWEFWRRDWPDEAFLSNVRNISVSSHWTEVELEYAGTLGVEVLYQHDVLADVRALKVKGNMNNADWETLKQMINLSGLDLSEASFTSIPEEEFNERTSLNYLVLPEGLRTIGRKAFAKTRLRQLCIPSTVTTLGNEAFRESLSYYITFAANSQLKFIKESCFVGSGLKSIALPNSVDSIESYCFENCRSLDSLTLSDAIRTLPWSVARGCTTMTYLHLPLQVQTIKGSAFSDLYKLKHLELPESLRTIESYAFSSNRSLDSVILPIKVTRLDYHIFADCDSLRYVKLPSSAAVNYDNTFRNCPSIRTIECLSATPPSIYNDPFSSGPDKNSITLRVPPISVVAYKLDPYWYQFGTIVEGEDPDYWDIRGELMLTNNRRFNGSPYVELNGNLLVSGSAPMTMSKFVYHCSKTNSGVLINSSPAMSADTAYTDYTIEQENRWYFVSPIYDVDLLNTIHRNGSQFVFRRYDAASRAAQGTGNSWQNVTDGVLHQGQGYILQSNGKGIIHMPSLNHTDSLLFRHEDVEMLLQTHVSENIANENWNFIGNPYPAYYDIWYMDFTAPITVWDGDNYRAYSLVDDEYALRPMEAFFVQKPEAVDRIIFHKEGRQFTSTVSHSDANYAPCRAAQNADRRVYNLLLTAPDGMEDRTRVVLNEAASTAYELSCDAAKFMSMNPSCPQLFTLDLNGNRLAINERPLSDGTVQLGVILPQTGEYTFAAVATPDITLIDHQTGVSHDLHASPYTFAVDMTGEDTGRFSLLFGSRPVPSGIEDAEAQNNLSGCVYTLDGKVAAYLTGTNDIHSLHLPAGVYMVRAGNSYTKIVVR